jgi:hypothetical protein
MKKSTKETKYCTAQVRKPTSKNKMYDSCIFRERFVGKESGWYTTNPSAKDLGGLEVFLVLSRSEV